MKPTYQLFMLIAVAAIFSGALPIAGFFAMIAAIAAIMAFVKWLLWE